MRQVKHLSIALPSSLKPPRGELPPHILEEGREYRSVPPKTTALPAHPIFPE
ncbi:hypothetical protein M7I_6039 [Glarea lozoyensis 74030]|uniref:Uncharacterized protein n=1 Tax=Glarea lozoyensis (strain ATCC 74030 / MF5533) TaxID=1104152 RepID=H0ETH6_GLAL7|nr:hypothetical protein M7I_6039 [Glarea lozoyensis 74030]